MFIINLQFIAIKNLGPIKELEFEVKRFGLVIGESAVGKSTLAKAIYLFKNLKERINDYFMDLLFKEHKITLEAFRRWLISDMESTFEKIYHLKLKDSKDLYLKYIWNNKHTITIQVDDSCNIKFYDSGITDEIYLIYSKIISQNQKLPNEDNFLFATIYRNLINKIWFELSELLGDTQYTFYIPANRNAIIDFTLPISIAGVNNLDYLTGEYFRVISLIKNFYNRGIHFLVKKDEPDLSEIRTIIIDILGGEYRNNDDTELFLLDNYVKIPLSSLSSGQKDTLWLLYELYYFISNKINTYVIIEEPESHIFTSLQKKVMDVIAFFANQGNNGVFITTHSPYIMLAANTLYYAGHFTGEAAAKAEEIVGKDRAIQPNDLTAIQLLRDGSRDLIDAEEHELRTGYIDDADEIHENYNKLTDLENFDDT